MSVYYRTNVAALVEREDGKIFWGERADRKGYWGFPQGGVDKGEKLKAALYRELYEETGIPKSSVKILEVRRGYRYKFPNGRLKWGKWGGQEQTFYRCLLTGDESSIRLDLHKPEFQQHVFIKPKKIDLGKVPDFKREVTRQVLRDFYGVGEKGKRGSKSAKVKAKRAKAKS